MNEVHVGRLIYRFKADRNFEFINPPPLKWDTPVFTMHLEGDEAALEMKERHSTAADARARVEEYLRSWEIDVALRTGGRIRLEYERAELMDSAPGVAVLSFDVTIKDYVLVADAGTYTLRGKPVGTVVQRNEYPQPPADFHATPLVETLWLHLNAYLEGRERLTGMTYFCVTAITAETDGDETEAAKRFRISREIIRTLKRLSSAVGTKETARKVTPGTPFRAHTPPEEEWIKSAVAALIRRVGEEAANPGADLPEITMSNLPNLS